MIRRIESWLENRRLQWAIQVALALGITLILGQFQFYGIEFLTSDLRMKWTPPPASSGNIMLVPIHEETVKRLGAPPTLEQFNQILESLANSQPHVIVSLINPFKLEATQSDLYRFANISKQTQFILAENELPPTGMSEFAPLAEPFEKVKRMPAPKTADRTVFAKDGITRRALLSYEKAQTLYPKIAADFRTHKKDQIAGTFEFLDSQQVYIRYHNPKTYPSVEFSNILNNRWNSVLARGKIIILGFDTKDVASQYITSPLSNEPFDTSELYLQANSIDTLILDDAPRPTPPWVHMAVTFLVALLIIHSVMMFRPVVGLTILLSSFAGLFVAGLILFYSQDLLIPLAQPLLAIFLCYYFVIPYRLIKENKRSWEYLQKNKLLTQVEELKSNFLRLVSHDLKTPLAKIQGMAEIASKNQSNLTPNQRLAIDEIMNSADELSDFVSSILNLSRVESSDVKLDLRSGDVNRVLEDVTSRCQYQAEKKSITLRTELEPLFSLKIDENLLKQVFNNLIENAIKYSPDGTSVLITTEDGVGGVTIQIADQGVGMTPLDLENVFEKFYRSKNVEHSTSGSGLGLYLAKYFVELHAGRISVESELNQGSTFTVFLPYELETQISEGELHA